MWFGKKYEYIYNMGDDTVPAAPVTNDKPHTSSSIKDRLADIVSAVAGRETAKIVRVADPDVEGNVSFQKNPEATSDSYMTPETDNSSKENLNEKDSDKKDNKSDEKDSDKKDNKSVEKGSEEKKQEEEKEKDKENKPKEEQELSTVDKIKKGFSLAKEAYKSLKKGDFNTFVDKANELRKMSKEEFGQFIQDNKISIKKTDQTNIFNELKKKNNIFSKIQQQKSSDEDDDGDEGDDNDDDNEEGDNEEDEDDNNKKMKITDSYVPDKEGNLPFVISGMMNSQNKISSINYIRICKEVITGKKDKSGKPGNIKLVNGKLNADPDITDRIKFATDKCRTKGGKPNLGGKKTRRHKKIHKSKKQIKRFLRKTKQNKKSL